MKSLLGIRPGVRRKVYTYMADSFMYWIIEPAFLQFPLLGDKRSFSGRDSLIFAFSFFVTIVLEHFCDVLGVPDLSRVLMYFMLIANRTLL